VGDCEQQKVDLKKEIFAMSSKVAASRSKAKQITKKVNELQAEPDTDKLETNQLRRVQTDKLLEQQAEAMEKTEALLKEKLDLQKQLTELNKTCVDSPQQTETETADPFECPPCDPLPDPREREPMVSAEEDLHWTRVKRVVKRVVAPKHAEHVSTGSPQRPPLIGEPLGLANAFPHYESQQENLDPQEQVIPWMATTLLSQVWPDRISKRISLDRRLATASYFL